MRVQPFRILRRPDRRICPVLTSSARMVVVRPTAVVFTLRGLDGTHILPPLSFLIAGNSLENILATRSAVHAGGAPRMDLVR